MEGDELSRRRLLSSVAAGTAVSIAGCTGGPSAETSTEPGTSTKPATATPEATPTITADEEQLQDTLAVALPENPTAGVWSVYGGVTPYWTNILEPLFWVSNQMELVPWLATEWEATSDITWEFTLREGVKFHNGETLRADHVVWSFKTLLNEWSFAPGWWHVNPENVNKIDDLTFEMETNGPFPALPGTIAHNMVCVQHPDRNREDKEVIGTGPYQVTNQVKDQRVETKKFPDYWGGEPVTENLVFHVITDPTTRTLALENHEIDVAFSPTSSKIESLSNAEGTKILKRTSPGAEYVIFNLYKEPTTDVKLRKALNYATSQKTIVDTILNGVGFPARGPIAKSLYWSAHEKLPEFAQDMDKARSLVEESSYNGETLQFIVSNEATEGKTIGTVLQQWFSEIGVDIAIQQMEDAAYDDAVRNGEAHLMLEEGGSNSGAADYLIYEWFHSQGDVNERLFNKDGTGLVNPGSEVDDLITKGSQTSENEKKEQYYEEALQIVVAEKVSIIPIVYQEYVIGARSDVKGLDLRPIDEMVRWAQTKHLK